MNHCLFKAKDTKGAVGNTVDYSSLTTKQLSLTPVRACVAPVCDFKSEVEELPMIDFLGLVGEM